MFHPLFLLPQIMVNYSKFPIKSTKHVSSPCDDGYIYIPVCILEMENEKRAFFRFFPIYYDMIAYIVFFFYRSTRNNIDSPLASSLSPPFTHAWMHNTAAPSALLPFFLCLSLSPPLFLSVCHTGGIYGDAVPGLSGGMLSLADQNRSTARRKPGQCAIQIDAA